MQVGVDFLEGSIAHVRYEEGREEGRKEAHKEITLKIILIFLTLLKNFPDTPINQLKKIVRFSDEEFNAVQNALKKNTADDALKCVLKQLKLHLDKEEEEQVKLQAAF